MSRRNQSKRRRSYGRRQHEIRERRTPDADGNDWLGSSDADLEAPWRPSDATDDRHVFGDSISDIRG